MIQSWEASFEKIGGRLTRLTDSPVFGVKSTFNIGFVRRVRRVRRLSVLTVFPGLWRFSEL